MGLPTTGEARYFHEVYGDIVGQIHVQAGHVTSFGNNQLRLLDGFFGGPWLVRGFAANGFGPRDITPGSTMDNVGGSMYWGASAELQSPIPNLPKDFGLVRLHLAYLSQSPVPAPPLAVAGQALLVNSSAVGFQRDTGASWTTWRGRSRS